MEKNVINATWYNVIVAERKAWIMHTEHQIKWHKEQIELDAVHLAQEKQWLTEALEQREEYLQEHPEER